MYTLNELLAGIEAGDLRVFDPVWHHKWFRPHFTDIDGWWHGLLDNGEHASYPPDSKRWLIYKGEPE